MDKKVPITVKFEIPYFTVSGIQVRYLKIVEKSGYQALPWVRYITQNGDDYKQSHFWIAWQLAVRQRPWSYQF
jgi:AP-1 complex subunit mu